MKNVVISTTVLHNPGDQVILEGVLNLIDPDRKDNYVYFHQGYQNMHEITHQKLLNRQLEKTNIFDVAVIAGTPLWVRKNTKIYEYCDRTNTPIYIIGVGGANACSPQLANTIKSLHKKGLIKHFSTRDQTAHNFCKNNFGIDVDNFICPSILSSPVETPKKKLKKIVLNYMALDQNEWTHQKHPNASNVNKQMKELYNELKKNYEVQVVVHWLYDFEQALKLFDKEDVFYYQEYRDYLEKYKEFDFYVGYRIHGFMACFSNGIPGVIMSVDTRGKMFSNVKKHFNKGIYNYDTSNAQIINKNILENIKEVEKDYKSISKDIMSNKEKIKQSFLRKI